MADISDAIKRRGNGLLAEFDGGFDPCVVGRAEAGEALVDLKRKNEVAELYAAVGVEAVDEPGFFKPILPAVSECFSDCCLGVAMGRVSRSD
jgi:hypothetical protein